MKREKQLQEIYRQLAGICAEVKLENAVGVYAINIYFENLIRDLLNSIFACQFENGNYRRRNQKGYDLIENQQRILVQVSSENAPEKIQDSLYKLNSGITERWRFCFFLIGEKGDKLRKRKYCIPENVEFSPKKDIWDMEWLAREIQNLDSDRIRKIYDILCDVSLQNVLTPEDIWNGVYRDYQVSMEEEVFGAGEEIGWRTNKEGVVHFNILERLLPDGYVSLNDIENNGINEKGERISLRSLANQDFHESMTIIGEGGIGKTTFLRDIMNRTYRCGIYESEKKIPIYIELSRTPSEISGWYSKKKQKSNFLIRYIAGIVYDLEWSDSSKEACVCYEKIEKELQKRVERGKEKYMLLLDGLNEVSMRKAENDNRTILDYLCMEIAEMRKYSNLIIILTSRRTRQVYREADSHVIELVGIQDEDVRWYLEKTRFSEVQINRILMDKELMICLRVPLFLCMFGNRKVEGKKTPCSRGEILYNFFHRDSPYYNEHRTAERIQREQYLTGTQITFIVDFLLPYIGWTMEYIEYYSLEESCLQGFIEEFLEDGERILWTDKVEPFDFYRKKHIKIGVIREELSQIPYNKILECITEGLGVMYMNRDGEGCFVHQHFRDYFAAVYEVQLLRMGYALSGVYEKTRDTQVLDQCEELLSEINENIWSEIKCSFVGEIAGEPRNRALYKEGRWTKGEIILEEQKFLNQALKTFRTTGILPVEGLYNLIETMKLTRKDLSGVNFSNLDLRGCRFNGAVCSHKMQEWFLGADFHGASISEETFQASGHNGIILQVQLSFDGENLFTLGEDGFLILWDSRTGKRLYSVQTGNFPWKKWGEPLKIEVISEFGVVLNRKEHLIKCDVYSKTVMELKKPEWCGEITDFTINPVTKKIAAIYDGNYVIIYNNEETEKCELVYKGDVLRAWCSANKEVLLLVQERENEFILKRGTGIYSEVGRFCTKGKIIADYCGRTNMFAAECAEGLFVMDLDSGWWNTYSLNTTEYIRSLKCHQATKTRIMIVSEKCCMEFDYEEQELWGVFEDERIAFPDMVQYAGEKVFFMDEFEHTYLANTLTGEVRRQEFSDTTTVQKLFVDNQRKRIIIVDSKQNVMVYDVLNDQMLMSVQYHRSGEFSNSYCYHEKSNMLVMVAVDYYHVRIFLIDLDTQQEKEIYSEITGAEIKEVLFSKNGKKLFVAMEKKLLAIKVETGQVQVIENMEEYRIHSFKVLEDDSIEVCVYYPIEFEKCKEKNTYAYRTIYRYDTQENKYIARLSGELPVLREKATYWAFASRETAYFKNKNAERGYLNLAVSWNSSMEDIEDNGKPIGFPDLKKYQIRNDFTKLTAVTYDTMLLIQSYDKSVYQLIEYGERGFFVRIDNIILEYIYTEQGTCMESCVVHPIVVDEEIMEVTFITWGFGENYYAILANGKVVEINKLGEIQKEFPVYTGISVVGCDFRRSVMDSVLKEKIMFHGGRF